MKKTILALLAMLLILSLCACNQASSSNENPGANTSAGDQNDGALQGGLTWDQINAFPIKYADMPIAERRQLCVDFFNFSKTALWTPTEDLTFYLSGSTSRTYTLKSGQLYGGLPYMTVSSGNVYRMMDFLNEETGQLDVSKYMAEDPDENGVYSNHAMKLFGNQCSYASWWGWARVVNSAKFGLTYYGLPQRGFILVGDYPDCGLEDLEIWMPTTREDENKIDNTIDVCDQLGSQQMYENYAKLRLGDGLVYVTSGGHFIMCVADPHVEYFADGSINGEASYILITEQSGSWTTGTTAENQLYTYQNSVNNKKTFAKLFGGNYVPFTFQEFQEGDVLEETQVSFSHQGSTITKEELFDSKVTANYGISDIHVIVTDDDGKEVYRHMVRAEGPSKMELTVFENIFENEDGVELDVVDTVGTLTAGTYNIKIEVQLGTGERPTVWTGKIILK